jgi:hypothetical protein
MAADFFRRFSKDKIGDQLSFPTPKRLAIGQCEHNGVFRRLEKVFINQTSFDNVDGGSGVYQCPDSFFITVGEA